MIQQATTGVHVLTSRRARPSKAEVIFGDPRQNCKGVGICRVLVASPVRTCQPKGRLHATSTCASGHAWAWPVRDGQVTFAFWKSSLCERVRAQFFQTRQFVIPASVPLSIFSEGQEMPEGWTEDQLLCAGSYPVRESDDYLWVSIPVC